MCVCDRHSSCWKCRDKNDGNDRLALPGAGGKWGVGKEGLFCVLAAGPSAWGKEQS